MPVVCGTVGGTQDNNYGQFEYLSGHLGSGQWLIVDLHCPRGGAKGGPSRKLGHKRAGVSQSCVCPVSCMNCAVVTSARKNCMLTGSRGLEERQSLTAATSATSSYQLRNHYRSWEKYMVVLGFNSVQNFKRVFENCEDFSLLWHQ